MRVETAPQDLSGNYTRSLVGLKLQDDPALQLGSRVVGSLSLAITQLVAKTLYEGAGWHTLRVYRSTEAAFGLSLRFRGIVIALVIAFLGYGTYILTQAKYDVFPEFAPPLVVIQTEAPGLSPEQIELLVTTPIEPAITGVPGIESLRSGSIQGISLITVTFQTNTDIYRARKLVAERLSIAMTRLLSPQGVAAPRLTPLTSSTSTVLGIGLTSQKLSPMNLGTIADWTVRLPLLAVPRSSECHCLWRGHSAVSDKLVPERLVQHDLRRL